MKECEICKRKNYSELTKFLLIIGREMSNEIDPYKKFQLCRTEIEVCRLCVNNKDEIIKKIKEKECKSS